MPRKNVFGTLLTVIITAIISGSVALALFNSSKIIPNSGTVKTVGVGVYWNSACTNAVSSIDWGMVDPESTKSVTVYVKNSGNVAVVLSMSSGNWNPPSASSYFSGSWNCTDYVLNSGSVIGAVLKLYTSSSISGITNFTFDMTITGTETS